MPEIVAIIGGYVYLPTDADHADEAMAQLQARIYHVLTEAGINADNIRVVHAEFRNTADET